VSLSSEPTAPELILNQLVFVRRCINESLDIIDVSTWTGDPMNASFISGQLRLLHDNLVEARQALKGEGEDTRGRWYEASAPEAVCSFYR
jgi:Rogdi leucine zipper containing protein